MRHNFTPWKLLAPILFCLGTLPLSAEAKPFDLGCITEHPTTSFLIQEVDDQMVAKVYLHHGPEFAPVFQGIATFRDFPILQDQAKGVLKLKNAMTFRWPMKKCKVTDAIRFQCFGTDDEQDGVDGAKVKPFALYSTRIWEDSIAGKLESVSIRLTFTVDKKESSAIDMNYPANNCSSLQQAQESLRGKF